MFKSVILTIALSVSMSSHAEFLTGNKLYSLLNGTDLEKSFAYGFVAGVSDAYMGVTHCPPENITIKQVSDMVLKALEQAPEHREKAAELYVMTATRLVWPCKQKNQNNQGPSSKIKS